ncbi:MAG: carboxypeptidase-like regulatory domain-containing protein, partial [Planctomycetota bacterium]|nr:carboxypeptidase-like regulatory domain-containing protein [Planctomycetota bacterium]
GTRGSSYFYKQITRTDENGRFKFTDLLPGHYSLLISSKSVRLSEPTAMHKQTLHILPDGPEIVQLKTIQLPETYKVTITVLGPDNQPKPGLFIRPYQNGRHLDLSMESPKTDSMGSYILEELDAGPLRLLIYQGKSFISNTTIDVPKVPSSQRTVILKRERASLHIELIDHLGKRARHGYVSLTLSHLDMETLDDNPICIAESEPLIHNKGRVSFENVPVGDYRVLYQYKRGMLWRNVLLDNVKLVSGPTKTRKIQLPNLD